MRFVSSQEDTKTAKPAVARASRTARKAPIARKNTPRSSKARNVKQSEVTSMREAEPVDVSEVTAQIPAHFEMSREPVRGGLHDGANHSKPEVQLQKRHIQVNRSPERRHTLRGH